MPIHSTPSSMFLRKLALVAAVGGFALASWGAVAVAEETAERAWMGVMLGKGTAQDANGEAIAGVPLQYVIDNGPAAEAGLRARDVVVSLNGSPVGSMGELLEMLKLEAPGNWVPVAYRRGEDEMEARLRLETRPTKREDIKIRRGWIGVRAIDLPPALREHFGAPSNAGAMVADIVEGSPAESAGLRLGDVIFSVDGEPVRAARHLTQLLNGGGVGNRLVLGAARDGVEIEFEALVATRPPKN